ncbi:transporter [Limobrevibacterium gyesilva]|uniref:Transporter n=1 Tax=Limobrevibacterium gyesilva TaxID=2991712 RepID=A0AA41YPW1_9PROT|nr:transporter [Limobrevibacterium gyesilva]MCW3477876.1 transporter [Limobrevibacterium gyesilva]
MLALAAAGSVFAIACAHAQDLEPRAYSASPIGTNFLVAGYSHTSGRVSLDPSLPITGVKAAIDTYALGYDHTFALAGRAARASLLLPYFDGNLSGQVQEQGARATRLGPGDLRLRFSVNLLGGPALTPAAFAQRTPTPTLGVSLIVIAPSGAYDPQRLVNISSNRWAVRPEIGLSVPLGQWFADASFGTWIFTDNNNFFHGHVRSQLPIYSVQVHGGYNFRPGLWLAADATYFTGGETSIDGVGKHDIQANSRYGLTLSVPLTASWSTKLSWSTWLTGRNNAYQTVGLTLQYRWFNRPLAAR